MNSLSKLSFRPILLVAFITATIVGCGEGRPEPLVPDKPPLSADEAKEKNEKLQRELLKSMEQQSKQPKK